MVLLATTIVVEYTVICRSYHNNNYVVILTVKIMVDLTTTVMVECTVI